MTYRFDGDHFGVFPYAMASKTLEKLDRNNYLFHVRQLKIVVGESWAGCFVAANGGTGVGIPEMHKEFQD